MAVKTLVEEWKTIPGFESYEVNRHGQIRNVKTGHVYKMHVSTSGHSFISAWQKDMFGKVSIYSHVLVKELFGIELQATRPARRRWQNVKVDPVNYNGTTRRKLSDKDVLQIKVLLRNGKMTQRKIAQVFGVAQGTISDIKCGVSWKDVVNGS